MIVVFPFEKQWYSQRGLSVEYFGHPVIDHGKLFNYSLSKKNTEINIAICPGSRAQEIKRHMPILSKLIEEYPKRAQKKVRFIIIQAPGVNKTLLKIDMLRCWNRSKSIILRHRSRASVFT